MTERKYEHVNGDLPGIHNGWQVVYAWGATVIQRIGAAATVRWVLATVLVYTLYRGVLWTRDNVAVPITRAHLTFLEKTSSTMVEMKDIQKSQQAALEQLAEAMEKK